MKGRLTITIMCIVFLPLTFIVLCFLALIEKITGEPLMDYDKNYD